MVCDKSCSYCIVKDYTNNPEHPDKIEIGELIAFLQEYMKDGDFAEITGGEPTLWPHLQELLDYLEFRNCYIVLRTNGVLPIDMSKHKKAFVYLAQHDMTDEETRAKAEQFKCYGIILNETNVHKVKSTSEYNSPENEISKFEKTWFIDNEARIRRMPCILPELLVGTLHGGINNNFIHCCPIAKCPFKQGAWETKKRMDGTAEIYDFEKHLYFGKLNSQATNI